MSKLLVFFLINRLYLTIKNNFTTADNAREIRYGNKAAFPLDLFLLF